MTDMTCPRCGSVAVYVDGDGWTCNRSDCGQHWTRIKPGTVRSARKDPAP